MWYFMGAVGLSENLEFSRFAGEGWILHLARTFPVLGRASEVVMRQHAAAGCMQRRTASVGCGLIHHILPTVGVAMQAAGAKAAPGWRGPKRRAPRAAVAWPPQPQCSEGGAPVRLGPTAAAGTGTCSGQQGFAQGVHHRITSRVLNATLQSVTTDWLLVLQSTDHAKAAGPWRFCSRSSEAGSLRTLPLARRPIQQVAAPERAGGGRHGRGVFTWMRTHTKPTS